MTTPSFLEDHASQVPALQLLLSMGYTYLPPAEALRLRGGKYSQVLLEEVLRRKLPEINAIRQSSSKTALFTEANIEAGIRALKEIPMNEGYMQASKTAWELLCMGKSLQQSVDGDLKSYNLHYINWERPEENEFYVTEEYKVLKATTQEHQIPDLVLFVNGIPLVVVECKRPDLPDALSKAIVQHLRNQEEQGIRKLYIYSQVLLALATTQASYGSPGAKEKHWGLWREHLPEPAQQQAYEQRLLALVQQPTPPEAWAAILQQRTPEMAAYLRQSEGEPRSISEQDRYLYNLCQPARLLSLVKDYVLFDGGEKKLARYQQYFAIQKIMQRIAHIGTGGARRGGVVWHTQGSGKSLTMAMLARQIALHMPHPKIVLATDRTDLDDQITGTFKDVEIPVLNAASGSRLVELLRGKSDAVITTIINKFETAVKQLNPPLTSPNIFVLIDEGHRTQYGKIGQKMRKVLPNACYIAFTGTPLMKKDKNTAQKFGGIIDPPYTVLQAVADGAVLPIRYEGRHALQDVNQQTIDRYFDFLSEKLTPQQKADLKRKFSRAEQIGKTEQRIFAIVCDIVKDWTSNWAADKTGDRSGFKGMVVCPDRPTAVKYKKCFDQLDRVSTEILFSPPDDRENEEDDGTEVDASVLAYYNKQKSRYGRKLEETIIGQFKNSEEPELLIVVDKLLTGFDEPKVVVMYLCRKLKEHKLLQAIARTNRLAQGKDYGLIIDYDGVLEELHNALQTYSGDLDFDADDLNGAFTNVAEETAKLPGLHAALHAVFRSVKNKGDLNEYALALHDIALRTEFYQKLTAYSKCLKIAFGSLQWEEATPEAEKQRYRDDLKFFVNLRNTVVNMYSDEVDFSQYEKQLQKLLDQHVTTSEIIRLTEQVDIYNREAFEAEVEKITGAAAQAETIASRTAKHIAVHMDEDPVFYKRLSELIQQTIADYRAGRLKELEFLAMVKAQSEQALTRRGADMPEQLQGREIAQAFYRIAAESWKEKIAEAKQLNEVAVAAGLGIDDILQQAILDDGQPIVDWQSKPGLIGKLKIDIGDYLIDEIRDKYGLQLSFNDLDEIANQCIEVAKLRYK